MNGNIASNINIVGSVSPEHGTPLLNEVNADSSQERGKEEEVKKEDLISLSQNLFATGEECKKEEYTDELLCSEVINFQEDSDKENNFPNRTPKQSSSSEKAAKKRKKNKFLNPIKNGFLTETAEDFVGRDQDKQEIRALFPLPVDPLKESHPVEADIKGPEQEERVVSLSNNTSEVNQIAAASIGNRESDKDIPKTKNFELSTSSDSTSEDEQPSTSTSAFSRETRTLNSYLNPYDGLAVCRFGRSQYKSKRKGPISNSDSTVKKKSRFYSTVYSSSSSSEEEEPTVKQQPQGLGCELKSENSCYPESDHGEKIKGYRKKGRREQTYKNKHKETKSNSSNSSDRKDNDSRYLPSTSYEASPSFSNQQFSSPVGYNLPYYSRDLYNYPRRERAVDEDSDTTEEFVRSDYFSSDSSAASLRCNSEAEEQTRNNNEYYLDNERPYINGEANSVARNIQEFLFGSRIEEEVEKSEEELETTESEDSEEELENPPGFSDTDTDTDTDSEDPPGASNSDKQPEQEHQTPEGENDRDSAPDEYGPDSKQDHEANLPSETVEVVKAFQSNLDPSLLFIPNTLDKGKFLGILHKDINKVIKSSSLLENEKFFALLARIRDVCIELESQKRVTDWEKERIKTRKFYKLLLTHPLILPSVRQTGIDNIIVRNDSHNVHDLALSVFKEVETTSIKSGFSSFTHQEKIVFQHKHHREQQKKLKKEVEKHLEKLVQDHQLKHQQKVLQQQKLLHELHQKERLKSLQQQHKQEEQLLQEQQQSEKLLPEKQRQEQFQFQFQQQQHQQQQLHLLHQQEQLHRRRQVERLKQRRKFVLEKVRQQKELHRLQKEEVQLECELHQNNQQTYCDLRRVLEKEQEDFYSQLRVKNETVVTNQKKLKEQEQDLKQQQVQEELKQQERELSRHQQEKEFKHQQEQKYALMQNEMVSIPVANLNGGLKAASSGSGVGVVASGGVVSSAVLANAPRVYLTPSSTFMANRQVSAGLATTGKISGSVVGGSSATSTAAGTVRYFSQFGKVQTAGGPSLQRKLANGDTIVLANGNKSLFLTSSDKCAVSAVAINGNSNSLHTAKTELLEEESMQQGTVINDEDEEEEESNQTAKSSGDQQPLALSNATNEGNASDDEPELDIVINNVVCSFSVGCHLKLREIALQGSNVEYRRENGMVTMKLRHPYTTASIWSSGRITCTGATSEAMAKVAARRYARCLGKLGFPTRFLNFRIVNVLGTCSMPWAIKIVNFSERHRENASYEPELHPGVTYKMRDPDPKATLKIFSTGSVTVTAASVSHVESAIQHIYPLVFEFRKQRSLEEMQHLRQKQRQQSGVDPNELEKQVVSDNKANDHTSATSGVISSTIDSMQRLKQMDNYHQMMKLTQEERRHIPFQGEKVNSASTSSAAAAASTSSTSSSSGDNICANARRRATECWATKFQNKRPRYNDPGTTGTMNASSTSTTSNVASSSLASQATNLRNPLKAAALANARMRGAKAPTCMVLKPGTRITPTSYLHQQQQQKVQQTSFSPSEFDVDDLIEEEESNEMDLQY